jgi:TonB family protein
MKLKAVVGKSLKVVVAVLLPVCFSFAGIAMPVAPPPVVAALTQEAAWQRLNAREDNFFVMLPVQPELTGRGGFTFGANGEPVSDERIASAYHNGVVYLVRIYGTPNPKRLLSKYPSIMHLSDAGESNFNVSGIEGKQYVKKGKGHVHTIRLLPTKKRLYVIETAARDESNADIRRFVASLMFGDAATADKPVPAVDRADGKVEPLPIAPGHEPLTAEEVTRPAVIIYKPAPPYPERAKQLRVNGTVKYRVVLSPSGEVTDIKVTQGLGGGLSEEIAQIVKSIKFLPAEKDGRLVPQYTEVTYNFVLR